MMNENTVKGKWIEIKGDLQKAWGKLTDDELEQTKGDMKSIGGLIQQRYGQEQGVYGKKLEDIFKRFDIKKDETVNSIKSSLKN
jgi:uncharacterized protein YjbJ (UPF0337 family)